MGCLNTTDLGKGVSIEMYSKRSVKSLIVSDDVHDRVLIDVDIGDLIELSFIENSVLEVRGINGVLRMDITIDELKNALNKHLKNKN